VEGLVFINFAGRDPINK
jgi:hypothetical protein